MVWDDEPWGYTTSNMSEPFSHDDLPLKQRFLEIAREFYANSGDSIENELAAALLYMNLADYLAEYLVTGMNQLNQQALKGYYLGVVAYIPQQKESFNIGNAIYALKGYDFPKKAQIMGVLAEINNSRKKIAHEIVKTKVDDLTAIDDNVKRLVEHTEELVVLVDQLGEYMPPPSMDDPIKAVEAEASNPKPKAKKKPTTKKRKSV